MKKLLLLMLTAMWASAQLHHGNISWELVEAIRQVESGGRNVAGDHGLARGQWQFHRGAWKDINLFRAKRKLLTYSYDFSWKEKVSRIYAYDYLHIQRSRFLKTQKMEPTTTELWYMWSLGYDRYVVQCKADIENLTVSERVRAWKKSILINNLIRKQME